jgi:hypothetical protein
VIAHVVLFKPKANITPQEKGLFAQSFKDTCTCVQTIRKASIGRVLSFNSFPAELLGDKTYEFAAYLEFDDLAGLKAYLEHPKHAELAGLFWRFCESTVYADVEMLDPMTDEDLLFGLTT